jgi:hypothetical protein
MDRLLERRRKLCRRDHRQLRRDVGSLPALHSSRGVIFFVSKIIKLSPAGCTGCLTNVAALAAALTPSWASANSTATSPIRIIDHYDSAFDPTNSAHTADGAHPTPAGAAIMATITVNAIAASAYF